MNAPLAPEPLTQPGLLEAHHLQKSFGKRQVVKDVSLSLRTGEVVGLLGPNGAGKTTSFYMLVGLVRSSGGDIAIDGQSIENLPIHRRARLGLGYLPQEASIFRKLNVEDNVRAVLELQTGPDGQPLSRDERESRLTQLLQDLHVEHLRKSPALALSAASAAVSRLPARSRPVRASSCSTSPLPASTRLPLQKYAPSSAF